MVIFHGYVKLPKANKTTHRESASITRIVKEKVRCKLFALVACQVRLKGLDAERSHGVPQHQSIQNHTHQFLFGPRFLTHLAMAQNYQPPIAGWFSYGHDQKSYWSLLPFDAVWWSHRWQVSSRDGLCSHFLGEAKGCQSFHLSSTRLGQTLHHRTRLARL